MLEIKFSEEDIPRHKCVGAKEGDWLIFKCTECDYIRKVNLKTGKSKSLNSNFELLHEGTFSELGASTIRPPEFLN